MMRIRWSTNDQHLERCPITGRLLLEIQRQLLLLGKALYSDYLRQHWVDGVCVSDAKQVPWKSSFRRQSEGRKGAAGKVRLGVDDVCDVTDPVRTWTNPLHKKPYDGNLPIKTR